MAIVSSVDIGCGRTQYCVTHDPTSTATDCKKGSLIIENSTELTYIKMDDGSTTNVKKLYDSAGAIYAGKNSTPLTNLENIQDNYAAVTAPTTTDDSSEGYAIGSVWIDVSADKPYICVDATENAAVWIDASGGGGGSGYSGYSGYSGISGYSGDNPGTSGYSGYSGAGTSGYSGYSGGTGSDGTSGYSGYSGAGTSGYSGYSGETAESGLVTLDILVPERLATLGTAERRLSPVTLDTQDSPGTPALESPDTLVPAHPATPGTVAELVQMALLVTLDILVPERLATLGTAERRLSPVDTPDTLAPAHPATPGTAASADTLETIQEPQDIPGTVVQEFRDTAAILVPMGP